MSSAIGELILSAVNTKMFLVAQINLAGVATPRVGMDHAVRIDSSPNDGQQRLSGTVRHDLGIDTSSSLEDSKDRGFAIGPKAPFALDALGAKGGFIDLCQDRKGLFTECSDLFPDQLHIMIDGVSV